MIDTEKIKVLIADDHQIVIDGIRSLLKSNDQIHIVGEALDGQEVLDILKQKTVDIAILDINMPIINGVEATKIIKEKYIETKVLFLTMHDTQELVYQANEIGADGYILKNKGKEELETAITKLAQGGEYFGEEANKAIRLRLKKKKNTTDEIRLTKREIDVLKLIADGATTPLIADKLFIAHSTVETHRRNLIEKTQVKNSKGLVRFAIENNYV